MMKCKKWITAAVVGFCMFLSACSNAPAGTPDIQKDTEDSAYTEITESDSPVTDGGSPWIDSDLKENLTADMRKSAKMLF